MALSAQSGSKALRSVVLGERPVRIRAPSPAPGYRSDRSGPLAGKLARTLVHRFFLVLRQPRRSLETRWCCEVRLYSDCAAARRRLLDRLACRLAQVVATQAARAASHAPHTVRAYAHMWGCLCTGRTMPEVEFERPPSGAGNAQAFAAARGAFGSSPSPQTFKHRKKGADTYNSACSCGVCCSPAPMAWPPASPRLL